MFPVVRRKTKRCPFSGWNCISWMKTCLFLHLFCSELSEVPLLALSTYGGIYRFIFWVEGNEGGKDHIIYWNHISRFGERGRKAQEKKGPKITSFSELVFRDVPAQQQVSGYPKTWDWHPNHHVPQKWPTLSSPMYIQNTQVLNTCICYYLLQGSRCLKGAVSWFSVYPQGLIRFLIRNKTKQNKKKLSLTNCLWLQFAICSCKTE